MHTLETDRLLLRPFSAEDEALILAIASDPETVKYLYFWGLPGMTPPQDAQRFLRHALKEWQREKITMREYCVILRETGEKIGDASVEVLDGETAEIGWILLPRYRGKGYATEAGRAMMNFGFTHCGASRVIAHCDARNAPSYHVMERLGMHLDEIRREARPAKTEGGIRGDEATYALSREDWARQVYRGLPYHFDGFMQDADLTDGDIHLLCEEKIPGDPKQGKAPSYHFLIAKNGVCVGRINLRIGFSDLLFFAGQIGYSVEEAWRGQGIAGNACRLLIPVMRFHGMTAALITNQVDNTASRRVCEKLDCPFLCRVHVPEGHPMREKDGIEEVNVFLFPASS